MAQFMGTIQGSRGQATRLGGKPSGLSVSANGWTCGVKVYAYFDETTGEDRFLVYLTGGSDQTGTQFQIGEYSKADLERLQA